ncbi:5'/3'-nucleotidase SurE [Allokutzneria sp. A3M-2-11 16]|uniref:5'/3'-nucleotidase SurE n=1 Tax=Allokutzneria sp. A3M-2-11 16 TaxID=2962043 RepID=UPI0020B64B5D|nr:5'/3'-nucleotidase SurE [Allokutzneria sp. A3M-2-11 16]MCP3805320.1 5'/3'-nucleotidase SurE [Allokutzneria sp. A3M-2-11 16]
MIALITNDDGIDSPGLTALARMAVHSGLSVVVAAPAEESSGTSAGLTAAKDDRRIAVARKELPGLPGVPAFAVAGHPGLITFVAAQGAFGSTPDLVLSGINRGANVGRAVLHSGTVGATLTASINDLRGLAVSLDVGLAGSANPDWEAAAGIVEQAIGLLRDSPAGTVLNVNVPDVSADRLRPLRHARLARFGTVQSRVEQLDDDSLEVVAVTIDDARPEPDSDAALLAEGHPTITALRSVSEDLGVELPSA